MYEQLLKLEAYELNKKPSISWERIMEIRHLKDRMVRKCKKLAKTMLPISMKSSRDGFSFQTFIAPADFRVKEMEKWFRDQQQRALSLPRRPTISFGNPTTSAIEASSSKLPIRRSLTNPEQSTKQKPPELQEAPLGILSPPPLPVLLLSHREEYGLNDPVQQTDAQDQQPNAAESSSRPLRRRPSCIKRNSLTEFKTVSWADNQEWDSQVDNYAAAAREAQASGERYRRLLLLAADFFDHILTVPLIVGKWDQVRVLYLEQITGLENLHIQVKEGLEHLRSETDHLQRIDEMIRKQRSILDVTFQEFEQKQALLQEKGECSF
jgi:hypothetical protein